MVRSMLEFDCCCCCYFYVLHIFTVAILHILAIQNDQNNQTACAPHCATASFNEIRTFCTNKLAGVEKYLKKNNIKQTNKKTTEQNPTAFYDLPIGAGCA